MIDWDDAFENGGYIDGAAAYRERWPRDAAAFVEAATARGGARLGLRYGDGPRNLYDLFTPSERPLGLIVFVHGGYWKALDRSVWSHLARGGVERGWAVAAPSYTLAPEARIAEITAEIGAAVSAAAAEVEGPLRLIGHSAGGHLVSRMNCADAPLSEAARARLVHTVSVSGVHDLRPLLATSMNETLRLTEDEAEAESPALASPREGVSICFWVGAEERPEFLRQNRLIAERWGRLGCAVRSHYAPGDHHFSVIDALADPDSALTAELLR